MIRLKHIIGVNVPRRVPSNVASPSRCDQHTGVHFKSHQFRSQLLKVDPLSGRCHDVGVRYSGQFRQDCARRPVWKEGKTISKQRSRTKSSVASLKRKSSTNKRLPANGVATMLRHCSAYQSAEFNSCEIGKRQTTAIINGAKNAKRNSSFVASVEKHPRTYAEMITDYSEALGSTMGVRNDGVRFNNMINRSLCSTLSASRLRKKIANLAEYGGVSIAGSDSPLFPDVFKPLDRRVRRDDTNAVVRHDLRRRDAYTAGITNRSSDWIASDLRSEDRSYARLVADRNKFVNSISPARNVSNGGLAPTRNVLAKNSLETFATATRKASSTNARDTSRRTIPPVATVPIETSVEGRAIDKIDKIVKRDPGLRRHDYSHLGNESAGNQPHFVNASKTHVRSSSRVRKSSTGMPIGGDADVLKQSRVELRMVPSERESVVSIDVDSAPTGGPLDPPDSLNSKQLSVIVRSDRNEDPRSVETQRDAPTFRHSVKGASRRHGDFGPMRISISEDSAPVKRIEFSIDGKPVSELRSITARTERLDVVSSSDKVEIRIPCAMDGAAAPNVVGTGTGDELSKRSDSGTERILNVQILANFQSQPAAKGNAERPHKSETTRNVVPISSPQTPKIHYAFENTARVRGASIGSGEARRQHGSEFDSGAAGRNLNEREISDSTGTKNSPAFKIQRETTKEAIRLSADRRATTVRFPEGKKYDKNESRDPRVPSKVVPWWSSSDCFNKIKRKDDRGPATSSNLNEKVPISNFKRVTVTESSSPKSREKPSSLDASTNRAQQSINGATFVTNNSNDLLSRSDLLEQRGESKPTVHSCLFRLKPNRVSADTVTDIVRNDSRIAADQTSTTKQSNKKISETKRSSPVGLSTSGTTNVQGEHGVSVESDTRIEKSSSLPRKFEAPCSAQVLPPNADQKEKRNCPSKQAKSIDNESSTKSRIENILDAIKPIEKKEDGTLIDYGLKVSSRKPTVRLNSGMSVLQNSSSAAAKAKEEASRKFPAEMAPRTEQIGNTMSTKQTELNKAKVLEVKMNITKEKEKLIVENLATSTDLQNKNDTKNIRQAHMNDAETSSSTNLRKPSSEEFKRNKPKSMTLQGSEESRSPKPPQLDDTRRPSEDSGGGMGQEKSPLKITVNEVQRGSVDTDKSSSSYTKPRLTSRTGDRAVLDKSTDKNAATTPITHRSANRSDDKADVRNARVKIATRNPTSTASSSKDREEDRLRKSKSGKDGGDSSVGSTGGPGSPSGSTGCKSSAPKRTKSGAKSNYSHARKLLFTESSYANFDRKDNTLSNLRQTVFEISRNPSNVDAGVLDDRASCVTGSAGSWTDTDRPEKSILYSAWLQRSRNDINNNEKLF